MSNTTSDEQQAAATSAFLAAMQQSHHQLHQQQLQSPPQSSAVKRENDDPESGSGAASGQPPRKTARKSSGKEVHSSADSPPAGTASTDSSAPAGPPYICPTCQTSYSRLEYLRRHERRHQDIRPFVCECGKGFSRSDVLSRHKRQCHYHLTGEQPSAEAVEAAAKKTRKPSMAKSRKRSQAEGDDSVDRKTHNGQSRGQGTSQSPPATSLMNQPGNFVSSSQPGPPPPLLPQSSGNNGNGASGTALPPPPPFYNQQQQQQGQQGIPTSYPQDGSGNSDNFRNSGFMSAIHHALNANTFQTTHHANYPASPESSASVNSRNSSPRLHYRDSIPYTQRSGSQSNSRQSSLRKGALDPYHASPLWDAQDGGRSSPAPGSTSSSRHGSVYGSGSSRSNANTAAGGNQAVQSGGNNYAALSSAPTSGPAPAFSYPANEFASAGASTTSGPHSQTLAPASDSTTAATQPSSAKDNSNTSRFSVPTGPLSPFSGMGLSSISPYLSAFSNARDTPLVSSPGRGIGPGTPTSSLNTNVFDYTMRPPAKPASNTTPGKPGSAAASALEKPSGALSSLPLKRKESTQREEPTTPSASVAMSATESGSLPALADFIDDQQRNAANGLLTLLGGGGAETPSRFVRGEGGGGAGGAQSDSRASKSSNSMDNNPGTTSANPSSNPFFEPAVTPGPEAFLLRLQGGEQERRAAGLLSIDDVGNNVVAQANGPPTSVLGTGLDTPGASASFDFSSLLGGTPGQATSNLGWLMSPSIQALMSSFTTPRGAGDAGSYFPNFKRKPSTIFQNTSLAKDEKGDTKLANGLHLTSAVVNERVPAPPQNEDGEKVVNETTKNPFDVAFEDASNPFFIPEKMFRSCYAIPHWELPPLTRLSVLAMHAQQNLLKHVPILHEPTFRLDTTPGCLAFAACMLGGHEAGRRWWAGEEVVPHASTGWKASASPDALGGAKGGNKGDGPTAMHHDGKALDEQDGQELVKPVVVTDKFDMLMRSFTERCHHEKDRVPVVQTLTLLAINNLLSSNPATRVAACLSYGTVVNLAQQAGLYDPRASHVSREIFYTAEDVMANNRFEPGELHCGFSYLPSRLAECSDEEKLWRQWCEYEGRRRTAFIVLVMDTVASLDAGLAALVDLQKVKHLPLPVPDTIWRSKDPVTFRKALKENPGLTFGEAMSALLCDHPIDEKPDGEGGMENGGTDHEAPPALHGNHGPFARLVMLIPVLRGIVHLLQGRMQQAAEPPPLQGWVEQNSHSGGEAPESGADWQVDLFKRALSRWREGWDEDKSCLQASSPVAQAAAAAERTAGPLKKEDEAEASSSPDFTSKTASGATPLCEDALPFYWLSHVLLGHATSRPVAVRSSGSIVRSTSPPKGGEQNRCGVSQGAETNRRVPDFRSMLRFAKSFVNAGEGINGSAGAWGLPLGGKTITTSIG